MDILPVGAKVTVQRDVIEEIWTGIVTDGSFTSTYSNIRYDVMPDHPEAMNLYAGETIHVYATEIIPNAIDLEELKQLHLLESHEGSPLFSQ